MINKFLKKSDRIKSLCLFFTSSFLILLILTNCSGNKSNHSGIKNGITHKNVLPGEVSFYSSDSLILQSFTWAKKQALKYAHDDGDAVGLWYEAALPQREAFCMRDVAHHSTGAQILGLQNYTLNMMRKFAENISESKDWCTYWEINRYNKPAPVDYRNDKEFWYNLPANFDVLDACYRQYLWTGDSTYIKDPVFLNYYSKSINEYIEHWDLGLDRILKRNRYMHVKEPLNKKDAFQVCRGLPSYGEAAPGELFLGGDLLAAQYAAYVSYSKILELNGNKHEASEFKNDAIKLKAFYNKDWYNDKSGYYYTDLKMNGEKMNTGEIHNSIYFGIAENGKRSIESIEQLIKSVQNFNVESRSMFPELFYRYGKNKEAYDEINSICNVKNARREYPEVSYATIGNIANGMMGIEANAVKNEITTLSHLTKETKWAEIKDVPVFAGKINVRHDGNRKTTLKNNSDKEITWIASFEGTSKKINVNGKVEKANHVKSLAGKTISVVRILVRPGESVVSQVEI